MSPRILSIPALTRHRASGRAVVRIDGHDHYLGMFGTPESTAAYERLIATYLSNGRTLKKPGADSDYTIADLAQDFLDRCDREYRDPEGVPNKKSIADVEIALRPLVKLFCDINVAEFGPKSLALYRERLIESGLARTVINNRVGIVRRAFKWGVSEENVPPSVFHGLLAVSRLKRGRCGAKEAPPVECIPHKYIEAALPFMPPPVRAMVELQLLTGARPGEIVLLRMKEIDTGGPVWIFRPQAHKNAWRGHKREIAIGPKGQEILRRFIRPAPAEKFLFSPRDWVAECRAQARANRQTPLWPSHLRAQERRRRERTPRTIHDRYSVVTYGRAIRRACEKARVPVWGAGRLRHNAATEARAQFGLEAACALLGHRLVETTQIYAEVSRSRALEIAAKVG